MVLPTRQVGSLALLDTAGLTPDAVEVEAGGGCRWRPKPPFVTSSTR